MNVLSTYLCQTILNNYGKKLGYNTKTLWKVAWIKKDYQKITGLS